MSLTIELSSEMESRLRHVNREISGLFFSYIPLLAPLSEKHYSTKVPDYRFKKKYVFCVLIPMINNPVVRVDLRTDDILVRSSILDIKDINMASSGRPGTRWVHFDVAFDEAQVEDSLRLATLVATENRELAS